MCVDVFVNNPFGSKKAKGNFLVHKRLQLKKMLPAYLSFSWKVKNFAFPKCLRLIPLNVLKTQIATCPRISV